MHAISHRAARESIFLQGPGITMDQDITAAITVPSLGLITRLAKHAAAEPLASGTRGGYPASSSVPTAQS